MYLIPPFQITCKSHINQGGRCGWFHGYPKKDEPRGIICSLILPPFLNIKRNCSQYRDHNTETKESYKYQLQRLNFCLVSTRDASFSLPTANHQRCLLTMSFACIGIGEEIIAHQTGAKVNAVLYSETSMKCSYTFYLGMKGVYIWLHLLRVWR